MKQNIEDLVASVKQEQVAAGIETPTSAVSGSPLFRAPTDGMVKEASEAQGISDAIAEDIGVENFEVSKKLEKVASQMKEAVTTDDIIKIASESGNADLLNMKTIATSLAKVIIAEVESTETI